MPLRRHLRARNLDHPVVFIIILAVPIDVWAGRGALRKQLCTIKKLSNWQRRLAKKAGDNQNITESVLALAQCYVKMGRVEEAMDLHKSLCDDIGKESMDPSAILDFAGSLQVNHEHSRALTILEEHLEAIERSWGKREQCLAYGIIAILYCDKFDITKSNVYFERQLPIAKETNDVESEALALHRLGHNYGCMGDYGNGMAYLEQALVIESERGDARIALIYSAMGDVLLDQEGREKEAILMYQKCVGLLGEENLTEAHKLVFLKLGEAYTKIGAWDDAIACLEKGLSIAKSLCLGNKTNFLGKQSLGRVYLEKFYSTDESLVGIPERNDELIRKALFWSEAAFEVQGYASIGVFLDLAQEYYFLGESEKAHAALTRHLDMTVKIGPSHCHTCFQICAKDAIMEKCSVCKVARYCSEAHSIEAWKKGRLCHKEMCPFLKRWRKMNLGKETTVLHDKLFNDIFKRIRAFKPK